MEDSLKKNNSPNSSESIGRIKRIVGIFLTLIGLFILLFITTPFTSKTIGVAWGISVVGVMLYLYGFVERWWNRP